MHIHEITPNTQRKTKKRVGRGDARGKTSGKGMKGQKARAGNSMRPELRDLIKKLPKLRGYRFSGRPKPITVTIAELDAAFTDGSTVNPATIAKAIPGKLKQSQNQKVKILATGETKKKFTIENCLISASAKDVIEKAGGKIA